MALDLTNITTILNQIPDILAPIPDILAALAEVAIYAALILLAVGIGYGLSSYIEKFLNLGNKFLFIW